MLNRIHWRNQWTWRPSQNWHSSIRPRLELLEERCMLSADIVLDWNAVALDAVKNDYDVGAHPDQGGPTRTARALAIVHVAMYDAAMAVDGEYLPFVFRAPAVPGTSMDAAVAQAAHDTLVALYPQQVSTFDAALETSLASIPARRASLGVRLGSQVARQILAARAQDGADGPMEYTPGTLPGEYRPDPLHPDQMIISPDWAMVKGFVIPSSSHFPAPLPPALTSQEYADAFNQVKLLGADGVNSPTNRTAEQTEIGIYWAYDGVADIGTPPRLYNQMGRVIAEQQGNTVIENARMFALINVVMHDVGCVLWTTKYDIDFWRPITAIREADPGTGPSGLGDGNAGTTGDPNWTPLGSPASNQSGTNFTPGFPAYTSGHAGFGASVFRMIEKFYGSDEIAFTFTSDELNGVTTDAEGNMRPLAPRSFTTLSQAAQENANSRVYLGVHWQFDVDQGLLQGKQVADYVFTHFARHTPTHQALFHIGKLVNGIATLTGNLAGAALAAIDQALATTNFHLIASPAPPLIAASVPNLLMNAPASGPQAGTAKATPVSLAFVNSSLGNVFQLPSTAKLQARK